MTPDEHPRHRHLADGPLSSLYAPSPSLSSFGAASVMMCCSARPASSRAPSALPKPMASSHHFDPFAKFKLVWRRICICRFCNHLNVLILDQTCIVSKVGWRSTTGLLIFGPPLLSPAHPPTQPQSRWSALTTLPFFAKFKLVWRRLCEALRLSSSLAGHTHRRCRLV